MPAPLTRLASALLTSALALGLVAASASVSAPTARAAVDGPDVSSHQHPHGYTIKWADTRAGGAEFAFVKATEGTGYTNPYFAGDFASVSAQGMVRGAYHYARPKAGTASAVAQARHFVRVAGRMQLRGDLPPVLDIERHDGLKPAALISWTRAYLNEVQRLTGRVPIVYTYPAFWRSRMANTTAFTSYPLWIATYRAQPILVGGWSTYAFWQYTDRAVVPGMADPVDMSVFNGNNAQLRQLANPLAARPLPVPKISAKLSRKTVKVGKKVTLKGSTSRALAGERLYRQGYWSGSWHTWNTATVSSKGKYTFRIKPTRKAVNKYRVYVRATSKHAAATSKTVKLRVK